MSYHQAMFYLVIICTAMVALMGIGLSFGPLKTDISKLKAGQTPESSRRRTRKLGYCILFCAVVMCAMVFYLKRIMIL